MEFLLFMLFSVIEGFAVLSLILALFRLRLSEAWVPASITIFIQCLQSFLIREDHISPSLVLAINVILFASLLRLFFEVPILWAFLVAVSGSILYGLLQNVIVQLSFGYFEIDQLHIVKYKGYLLQVTSSVATIALSRFLYSRGIGFTFEFKELKKGSMEHWMTVISIFAAFVVFASQMFFQKNANFVILSVALGSLLIYLLRKERAHND